MLELLRLDHIALFKINRELASPTLDPIMRLWSAEWPWFAILAVFVGSALFRRKWRRIAEILWIGTTIGLTDMTASFGFKPWIARLRPCKAEDWIRIVDGCNGMNGFPSNHASNAAVFATMWWALYGSHQGWIAVACGLIVGFSRVYLGVHYPSDIFAAYLFGFAMGCTSILIGRRLTAIYQRRHKSSREPLL